MGNGAAKRPPFLDALLTDLRDDYRRYGIRKLVPWIALFCCGLGYLTVRLADPQVWQHTDWQLMFFGAAATINGLFLALSWGSFAKIYEIAGKPKFAAFLRANGVLETYFFQVDYIHLAQVLALAWSALALVMCVVHGVPFVVRQVALGGEIATSIYAFRYALGAVRIMQDLVWYGSIFDGKQENPPMQVHDGGRAR